MNEKKRLQFVLMKEHPMFGYALFYAIGSYLAFVFEFDLQYAAVISGVFLLAILIQTLRLKKSRYLILLFCLFVSYIAAFNAIPSWYKQSDTPPEECYISGDVIVAKEYDNYARYTLANVEIDGYSIPSNIILTSVEPKNRVDFGKHIITTAELEIPAVSQVDGLWDERRYDMTKNIQYTATVFNKRLGISKEQKINKSLNQIIHDKIYLNLSQNLNTDNTGLVYALSTGDKAYMNKDFYNKCCDLGISHVFAISGLHLGILLGLLVLITLKLRVRYLFRIILSTLVICVMMTVIGNRVSLLRAGIMAVLILLYNVQGIQKDALNILSICVLILLVINPLYIIDAGFILSVSSVLAITIILGPLNKRFKDKKIFTFYPIAIFITSLCISFFNFLLLIRYFGQVSLLSPIWNIIFIPLITIIIILILIYAVTFYIPYVGLAVIKVIGFIAGITQKLVDYLHKINFLIKIDIPSILAVISLMGILLLMTNFVYKNRQKLRVITCSIAIVLLLISVSFKNDEDKISIMTGYEDVFVLIESDNKKAIVVNNFDKGIVRVLNDINISELDMLIFTGNDYQDLTDLDYAMGDISVKDIYLPNDIYQEHITSKKYHPITENISIGDVNINVDIFKANKKAVVNYYAIITTPQESYAYLDAYKLREGAIPDEHILICSRWSKARIKNIDYANTKYVIINSNNYCMDMYYDTARERNITMHNINNSGAVICPIEDKDEVE